MIKTVLGFDETLNVNRYEVEIGATAIKVREDAIETVTDLPTASEADIEAAFGAAVDEQVNKPKTVQKPKPTTKGDPMSQLPPALRKDKNGNIPAVSAMRRAAVAVLEAYDPEAFAEYGKLKYANSQDPTLEDRIKAYEFAIKRAMEIGYGTANK